VKATFETQIRQQRANGDIKIEEIQRQANQVNIIEIKLFFFLK
jgi:hypothetical protein